MAGRRDGKVAAEGDAGRFGEGQQGALRAGREGGVEVEPRPIITAMIPQLSCLDSAGDPVRYVQQGAAAVGRDSVGWRVTAHPPLANRCNAVRVVSKG
jgi:hypothetical protein